MLRYILFLLAICPLTVFAQGPDSLWEPLPLQFDNQVNGLYADTTTGDLYITDYYSIVNGDTSCLVKWDGNQAILFKPHLSDGFGVMRYKNKLILSGIANPQTPTITYRLMAYDGVSWTDVDSFDIGNAAGAISILDGNLVITGSFDSIAGHSIRDAAIWDGNTGWSDFYRIDTAVAPMRPTILSIVKYKGEVYVGGGIYGPRNMTHILRFDGTNWKDVGGGLPAGGLGGVNCMLVWKNELYVAGEFREVQGSPGNCIVKWDGQRWHRLGNGITQGNIEASIYDMAVYHDNLYVVGVFSEADGVPVNNIAKWDGSRWCSLNTDFDIGTPSQIEVAKGELYISGMLQTINGKTVSHVAHWTGGDYVYQCGPVRLGVDEISKTEQTLLHPNPANDRVFVSANDVASIAIVDATGKLVLNTPNDRRGIDVSRLAAGVYFVRIIGNHAVKTMKLVLRR